MTLRYFCKRLVPGETVEVGSIILLEDGNLYIVTEVDVRNGRAFGEMKYTQRRYRWHEISRKVVCL